MKKRRSVNSILLYPIIGFIFSLSAFFYIPIDSYAYSSSISSSSTIVDKPSTTSKYANVNIYQHEMPYLVFDYEFDDDTYYSVSFDSAYYVAFDRGSRVTNLSFVLKHQLGYDDSFLINSYSQPSGTGTLTTVSGVDSGSFIAKGSWFDNVIPMFTCSLLLTDTASGFDCRSIELTLNNLVITPLSTSSGSGYDDGYDAGYDAGYHEGYTSGQSAGFSAGYSSGYNNGLSDGTNIGFQQGVESVDTQSYYDSGYQAGYNAGANEAYQVGFDAGFTSGYDDAMSRIDGWGADTSDYPLLLSEISKDLAVTFSIPSYDVSRGVSYDYDAFRFITSFDDIDPNHVYKISLDLSDVEIDKGADVYYDSVSLWFVIGAYEYPISSFLSGSSFAYIPGDVMTSDLYIKISAHNVRNNRSVFDNLYIDLWDCNFKIFDYGPSGNTQNHIANQTDQLTNGYDDTQGNETSSKFSDGIAEYDEVEGSLFTSAKSGLTDYEFFDIQSVPAVITGLSFATSIMTSIFNSMGGASGAGIVLSVLFSVMLVSMVSGLYRYFVSNGRSGKHSKKGGGN